MTKIAFQGEKGAFSEAAAYEYFGKDVQTLGCPSFDNVFEKVQSRDCEFGLLPIENSVAGSIHQNYDLLLENNLFITGEHFLHVRQCLIAHPGINFKDIRHVISHPQALGQCRLYIKNNLKADTTAVYDTAGSVKMITSQEDKSTAAIASKLAAEIYGMNLLAEGIEDNPHNFTRFLAVALQPLAFEGPAKTSIVFSLCNEPGTLYKALGFFASRNIDLTKMESRPLVGKPWEYQFYIDLAGSQEEPLLKEAIQELEEYSSTCRVLGSYPRHMFSL